MSNLKILVAAMGGVALVACAPMESKQSASTWIRPVQTVRHGSDADMLYRAGRIFQQQGRYDEALVAYRQAIVEAPKHVEARNGLAVVYALKGDAERAENEFRIAIEMAPEAPHLHNNLGYHLMKQGRVDEAREELARAQGLDPSSPVVAANLGAISSPPIVAMSEPKVANEPLPAPAREAQPLPPLQPLAQAQPLPQARPVPQAQPLAEVQPPQAVAAAPAFRQPEPQAVAAAPAFRQPEPTVVAMAPASREAEPSPVAAPASRQAEPQPVREVSPAMFQHSTFHGYRIEVANGNGTTGLARRTSWLLGSLEFAPARLTNDKPYGRAQSTVQYVAGAEDAAREVSAHLPKALPITQVAKLERNAKVRVLLGNDFPAKDPAIAQARPPKPRA